MSQAIIFGLNSATLHPRTGFRLSRGPAGNYTGSLTFSCLTSDWSNSSVLTLLRKGTSLALLYAQLPPKFDFLVVDSWDIEEQGGGWTLVSIKVNGQPEDTGSVGSELDDENASITYTRTTSFQQISIFDHPKFKEDLTTTDQQLMKEWQQGLIMPSPSDADFEYDMVYTKNDQVRGSFEGGGGAFSNVAKWYEIIIVHGILTWESPVSEWTKSGSRKEVFGQAELDKLGQAPVTPPLSPPAPRGQTWRYTAINEDITMVGVSETVASNNYSQTWSSGFWDGEIFNHLDFGESQTA